MTKEYTLIHPDIDPGRGDTKRLIDSLIRQWRDGTNKGAGEIAAVVDLLSDDHALPNIYHVHEGGVFRALMMEFSSFIGEVGSEAAPFLDKVKRDRGWESVSINTIGLASATGGIYASLAAAGAAGGEVIVASLNYPGVINAITMNGATPRFVDIDERDWCLRPDLAARAITPRTRGIILTHLNCFADIEPFYDMYKKRGLDFPLIQDASLAVGSMRNGLRPGAVNIGPGGTTVTSLTVSKAITGLGGAIVTSDDAEFLMRVFEVAHQGISLADVTELSAFGSNFKMSAINAAIALEQMKRRDGIFAKRRRLRGMYDKHLRPLIEDGKIALQDAGAEAVITSYVIKLPVDIRRVAKELYAQYKIQIGTWQVHHMQEIYRRLLKSRVPKLPVTESLNDRFAMLPFHTRLDEEDVVFICESLSTVLGALDGKPNKRRAKK